MRRRDAVELRAANAQFVVRGDELRVRWTSTWEDSRDRRVTRRRVRGIHAVPDERLVSGEPTLRLNIELNDGEVITPMRRQPTAHVKWAAALLGMWLRGQPIPESPRRPLDDPQLPPGGTSSVAPAGPVRATSLRIPLHAAPRPRHCRRRASRRGGVVLRCGPAPMLATHPKARPLMIVFLLVALAGTSFAAAAIVETGQALPGAIFGALGAMSLGLFAWGGFMIRQTARGSHVVRLDQHYVRIMSLSRRSRKRTVRQGERVPRAEVMGVTVGWTSDQHPEQRLDVLLSDGGRVGWMTGRPVAELRWLAAELDAALPRVPVAPVPVSQAAGATGPDRILPYESPKRASYDVIVRPMPDAPDGVMLIVPLLSQERLKLWLKWLIPMFASTVVGVGLLRPFPAVTGFAALVAVAAAARLVVQWRRGDAPTVLSVDAEFLYADMPARLGRLRRWRRRAVREIHLGHTDAHGRVRLPCVAIEFIGRGPLLLFPERSEDDRRRIAGVLRAALAMPPLPPPPSMST